MSRNICIAVRVASITICVCVVSLFGCVYTFPEDKTASLEKFGIYELNCNVWDIFSAFVTLKDSDKIVQELTTFYC